MRTSTFSPPNFFLSLPLSHFGIELLYLSKDIIKQTDLHGDTWDDHKKRNRGRKFLRWFTVETLNEILKLSQIFRNRKKSWEIFYSLWFRSRLKSEDSCNPAFFSPCEFLAKTGGHHIAILNALG